MAHQKKSSTGVPSGKKQARDRRQGVMKAMRRKAGEVAGSARDVARKTGKKIQRYRLSGSKSE